VSVGFGANAVALDGHRYIGCRAADCAGSAVEAPDCECVSVRQAVLGHRPALALMVIGLLGGMLLPQLRPARLTDGGALRGVDSLSVPFDGGLLLLGVDIPTWVTADEAFNVTLYWRAEQTPQADLLATVALRDAAGVLWSAKKSETPPRFRRAIPTNAWSADRYAVDVQQVVPLPGTPPGQYEVIVTLFERESLQPLPVRGTSVTNLGIGSIQIEWPANPVVCSRATPRIWHWVMIWTLIGYESDRDVARPGDPLLLTLFWRAADVDNVHYQTLELSLIDANNSVEYAINFREPQIVSMGRAGDRWRTQHALRLPAALESGDYRWQMAVCQRGECRESHTLGTLAIDAPEHSYRPPDVAQIIAAPIGPGAMLYGIGSTWSDGHADGDSGLASAGMD
jgi:hypothetical protein